MPLTQFKIFNEALSRKCLTRLDIFFQFCCMHTADKMCLSAFPFCQYAHLLLFIMNNADSVLQIQLTNHHQHPNSSVFSVKSVTDFIKNIHQSPYTTFTISVHNIHAGTKLVLASMLLHSGFQHHNFKTICYSLPGQRLFRMKQKT
jgi:hypothetical protein